jgi:hypothetical protein
MLPRRRRAPEARAGVTDGGQAGIGSAFGLWALPHACGVSLSARGLAPPNPGSQASTYVAVHLRHRRRLVFPGSLLGQCGLHFRDALTSQWVAAEQQQGGARADGRNRAEENAHPEHGAGGLVVAESGVEAGGVENVQDGRGQAVSRSLPGCGPAARRGASRRSCLTDDPKPPEPRLPYRPQRATA